MPSWLRQGFDLPAIQQDPASGWRVGEHGFSSAIILLPSGWFFWELLSELPLDLFPGSDLAGSQT